MQLARLLAEILMAEEMKKIALHWWILLGMALGILVGVLAVSVDNGRFESFKENNVYQSVGSREAIPTDKTGLYLVDDSMFVEAFEVEAEDGPNSIQLRDINNSIVSPIISNWVKPIGQIFVNLLKLVAIPLIIVSLLKGISDLKDLASLSRMGFRTVALYLFTTVLAVTTGLFIVNVVQPGKSFDKDTREDLISKFETNAADKITDADSQKNKGPLQPLVDLVPDNIFNAATSNRNMLQVIFFVVFFGVGMLLIDPLKAAPVKAFFDGMNDVILKLIDLIMLVAPIGVFALLASLIVDIPSFSVFIGLLKYCLCVVSGLVFMMAVVYPGMVWIFTGKSPVFFFKGISPAQMLAFSTSSSAATLPVTMERVEEHLGVEKEVSSFVLPIGATVNMDGTSLYQAIAAVFIAQATMEDPLTITDQLNIVLTATLASIGSAAVPGAGMVMLVIVLGVIGVPEEGLALIFAVDRILDMCRTTVNVTGDATVSMLVAKSVGKLGEPKVKNWDDNLDDNLQE